MTGRNGNETFAQIPASVIESGLSNGCVRLYSYVVLHSGPRGQQWVVKGASDIADHLSMQSKTLMTHAERLAEVGLISYKREGMKMYHFKLLHCPVKGLINDALQIPQNKPRARKTSRPPVLRKTNFGCDENRRSDEVDPVAKIDAQPKYAKRYEGIGEPPEWHDWRSQYFQEGPKCLFEGCGEFVHGHVFSDHEPLLSKHESSEVATADDIDKLILEYFPGAELLIERGIS